MICPNAKRPVPGALDVPPPTQSGTRQRSCLCPRILPVPRPLYLIGGQDQQLERNAQTALFSRICSRAEFLFQSAHGQSEKEGSDATVGVVPLAFFMRDEKKQNAFIQGSIGLRPTTCWRACLRSRMEIPQASTLRNSTDAFPVFAQTLFGQIWDGLTIAGRWGSIQRADAFTGTLSRWAVRSYQRTFSLSSPFVQDWDSSTCALSGSLSETEAAWPTTWRGTVSNSLASTVVRLLASSRSAAHEVGVNRSATNTEGDVAHAQATAARQ